MSPLNCSACAELLLKSFSHSSTVQFVAFCFASRDGRGAGQGLLWTWPRGRRTEGRQRVRRRRDGRKSVSGWWKPGVNLTSSSWTCFDSWRAKLYIMKKLKEEISSSLMESQEASVRNVWGTQCLEIISENLSLILLCDTEVDHTVGCELKARPSFDSLSLFRSLAPSLFSLWQKSLPRPGLW